MKRASKGTKELAGSGGDEGCSGRVSVSVIVIMKLWRWLCYEIVNEY
jgi:hypothetical protein